MVEIPWTQQQGNPLQYAQSAIALRQAALQNQAAQQEFAARQALGPILQGAVDPNTGELDFNKAFVGMSQDPRTAWKAQDFLNQAVARQATQAETAVKALDAANKRTGAIASAAGALLPLGDNVTRKDVIKAATDLRNQGWLDSDQFVGVIQGIPAERGPALNAWLKQLNVRGMTAKDAMETVLGKYETIASGDGTSIVRLKPGEAPELAGRVQNRPTLESQNELVEQVRPDGSTVKVPRSQVAPMAGLGPQGSSPYEQSVQATEGTTAPLSLAPGGEAVEQGSELSGGGSSPAAVSKLSPYKEKLLEGAAKYKDTLAEQVDAGNQQLQALNEMERVLPLMRTGGGTEARMEAARVAQTFGSEFLGPERAKQLSDSIAGGDLGAMQEFRSLAFNFAVAQMRAALGTGQQYSNQEMQNFVDNKVNLENDPRAVERLLKYYNEVIQVKQKEQQALSLWEDKGKDPTKFRAWWSKALRDSGYIKPVGAK